MRLRNLVSTTSFTATAQKRDFAASCAVTDKPLTWVCVVEQRSDLTALPYAVEPVDITNKTLMPAIGVIIEKPAPTVAIVQWSGEVEGFQGLVPGRVHFAGEDGSPVPAPPFVEGAPITCVQRVGMALSSEAMLVIPDFSVIVAAV